MSISRKITEGAGSGSGGSSGGYVDDVFSTYVYEGNDTQRNIENGIDLLGEGGLVWDKGRTRGGAGTQHVLTDTERGPTKTLASNDTGAETVEAEYINGFLNNGFSLGDQNGTNGRGHTYVSWTFRKAPSFFDVVTYTGDGVAGREIPHNLGVEPGMVIVKSISGTESWRVYHRTIDPVYHLVLNDNTKKYSQGSVFNSTQPTSEAFTVGSSNSTNGLNQEYVAYVFAHDDSEEGMIQCGSYTGTGDTDGPEIDLGWEPQWLLTKNSTASGRWTMIDAMRPESFLYANDPDAEGSYDGGLVRFTSTGFKPIVNSGNTNAAGGTMIYMAIRRPNKPAEEFEPDELFAMFQSGNLGNLGGPPGFRSGFPVDMAFWTTPNGGGTYKYIGDRLNQGSHLYTHETDSAYTSGTVPDNFKFDYNNGYYSDGNASYFSWMWRRAPGFFDVVAYKGTADSIPHNLDVPPEMVWFKERSGSNGAKNWTVFCTYVPPDAGSNSGKVLNLNTDGAAFTDSPWTSDYAQQFTATEMNIRYGASETNAGTMPYIAYLFASVPGICDIGSFTGNGGALNIDCGFTNGARFVLIKRTDEAGDWMYFDTVRGINATGSSPHLALNNTEAEVTFGGRLNSLNAGFKVSSFTNPPEQNTNASGGSYIYMAIA